MKPHQEIQEILNNNKDGSYSTQAARSDILHQVVNDLHEIGYKDFKVGQLGGRHVDRLFTEYKERELSPKTEANRASAIRWLSRKIGKQNIIPRTNKELGILPRSGIAFENSARDLPTPDVMQRFTEREQLSLQLQRDFGMRREESLKFNPSTADKGDRLELKGSWCKGNVERSIPILTEQQRELINKCHEVAAKSSMIEKNTRYVDAVKSLANKCYRNNIKMHTHRHAYAQQRYTELTKGRVCPVAGGEKNNDKLNKEARLQIAKELGHNRVEVTNSYLGSSS